MKHTNLNQYRGRLSSGQIVDGINHAIANAKRLFSDADLLLKNNRYPSALGLAILALEEAGKVSILRNLATAKTNEDVNHCWKSYRTHIEKNWWFAFPNAVATGARILEDYRSLFSHPDLNQLFDHLKQVCLYTDCLGNAYWSVPDVVIDKEITRKNISDWSRLVMGMKDVTELEIELWIKHMGPVRGFDIERQKDALANYYLEMNERGLYKGDIEHAIDFIKGDKYWKH